MFIRFFTAPDKDETIVAAYDLLNEQTREIALTEAGWINVGAGNLESNSGINSVEIHVLDGTGCLDRFAFD